MAQLTGRPTVGASADGRLEVFVNDTAGTLYHIWQTTFENDKDWSNWFPHGTPPATTLQSSPVVWPVIGSEVLVLYTVGTDNAFYALQQLAPNNGWSDWGAKLDTPPGVSLLNSLEIGTKEDGRRAIFVLGADRSLYHLVDYNANWLAFGGQFSGSPTMALSADRRQELFVIGIDGALYHKWEPVSSNAEETWSNGWSLHGTPPGIGLTGKPAIGTYADGRMQLFVVGTDGALYRLGQIAPNNGWSVDWYPHGTPPGVTLLGSPVVRADNDGRLELFVVGTNGTLYHIWQTGPDDWSDWYSHGTPPNTAISDSLTFGIHVTSTVGQEFPPPPQDLRLVVFAVGTDGNLYSIWQTAPNNGWSGWYSHGQP